MSRNFHPRKLVPQIHVSHFPPLQHGAAFSCPASSCLAFSASPSRRDVKIHGKNGNGKKGNQKKSNGKNGNGRLGATGKLGNGKIRQRK